MTKKNNKKPKTRSNPQNTSRSKQGESPSFNANQEQPHDDFYFEHSESGDEDTSNHQRQQQKEFIFREFYRKLAQEARFDMAYGVYAFLLMSLLITFTAGLLFCHYL